MMAVVVVEADIIIIETTPHLTKIYTGRPSLS